MRDANELVQSMPVYPGHRFTVSSGANLGDPVSYADDLVLDDVYRLLPETDLARLVLILEDQDFRVSPDTEIGLIGAGICLDCSVTLMSPDGNTAEALIFVELDTHGHVQESYLMPLVPLTERTDYALVGVNRETARKKLAQVASVSFARGTKITLGSGKQVAIEDLRVGDRVLTRDAGVQDVRWIGQTTQRAVGDLAPIRVAAGTLNNLNDLILAPEHRLFIYQRTDRIGAGRAEILVKARHLVNGDTVTVQKGGFIEYFQLLFDQHQIIYAEGIAAESFLVDTRTQAALPAEISRDLLARDYTGLDLRDLDVQEALLDRPNVTEVLKDASTR
ncbi:MAG: Hint domain-containing protein [Pseudomonadota bacterium]